MATRQDSGSNAAHENERPTDHNEDAIPEMTDSGANDRMRGQAEEDDEFELPRRRSSGKSAAESDPFGRNFEGVIPNLRRRYEEGSWAVQEDLEPYRTLRECPVCHGQRLKPQSLAVKVKRRGIAEYVNLPISEALDTVINWLRELLSPPA